MSYTESECRGPGQAGNLLSARSEETKSVASWAGTGRDVQGDRQPYFVIVFTHL